MENKQITSNDHIFRCAEIILNDKNISEETIVIMFMTYKKLLIQEFEKHRKMSHITKFIDNSLTSLSKNDIDNVYLEVYPNTPEENKPNIMSSLTLTHSFDNGGYIEDENAYILVFIPATANTLIIKKKQTK